MNTEPIIDGAYIRRTIREAKEQRARDMQDAARNAFGAIRWGGLTALIAFCLGLGGSSGPNGGAGT
jgi:hypothetical protein